MQLIVMLLDTFRIFKTFRSLSWKDIKEFILKRTEKKDATEIDKKLHDMWIQTKELTGNLINFDSVDSWY